MELDALKSEWKHWGEETPKQQEQIRKMAEKGNFKFLKHIKRRLLIESGALFLLLIVYFDWFDGHLKPIWVNILLACSLVLFIGHDLMVYYSLNLHLQGKNLKESLNRLLTDLKFQARIATVLITVFYIAMLTFLTININFTQTKVLMLLALVLICGGGLWMTITWWQKRLRSLKKCISELQEE
jgi:hypothetical protein